MADLTISSIPQWLKQTFRPYPRSKEWWQRGYNDTIWNDLKLPLWGVKNLIDGVLFTILSIANLARAVLTSPLTTILNGFRQVRYDVNGSIEDFFQGFKSLINGLVQVVASLLLVLRIPARLIATICSPGHTQQSVWQQDWGVRDDRSSYDEGHDGDRLGANAYDWSRDLPAAYYGASIYGESAPFDPQHSSHLATHMWSSSAPTVPSAQTQPAAGCAARAAAGD